MDVHIISIKKEMNLERTRDCDVRCRLTLQRVLRSLEEIEFARHGFMLQ